MPLLYRALNAVFTVVLLTTSAAYAQEPGAPAPEVVAPAAAAPPRQRPPRIVRLGVTTPGVQRPLESIEHTTYPVEGTPDWSVVLPDAVWVSSARANHVVQLLAKTDKVGLIADVQRPCAGLTFAFGSIWAPSCGATKEIERLDPATGQIIAAIPAEAANSEGGIANGAGAIWFVVKPSKLIRIDPATNAVTASLDLPSESENPTFAEGFVWVSSFGHDALLKIDPRNMTLAATIPIGPKPRFLTVGEGSVWTLNQGDGSISRVDIKTGKLVTNIACGIQGGGGEISYGEGSVWAAMFDFPVTQVDPKTNTVVKQWAGQGGDGIRAGLGSVWLSNLRQGTVWRFSPKQK